MFQCDISNLLHAASLQVSTTADTDAADNTTSDICTSIVNCTCVPPASVQCTGISSLELLPPDSAMKRLVLKNSHLPVLNTTSLQHFPQLQFLIVDNSSIHNLTGIWQNPLLESISLSNNNFTTFRLQWLDDLPGLRSLDLSENPLRHVVGHPPVEARLALLNLSGRDWDCTDHSMTWLVEWLSRPPPRSLVRGGNDALCNETRKQYQTMNRRPLVEVLQLTDVSQVIHVTFWHTHH